MFDYGAYNAVMRGQPYPIAPDEILSGDGRVYMHWDFHRQQPYCHQSHARPYILPNIGAPADEAPVGQLQDSTLVPSNARATYGVEGQGGDAHDHEDDEEHDEGDPNHDAAPAATAPPRSRGPRL